MGFRYVVGGVGMACAAWGGWLLFLQPEPWRIAVWLGGAVVVHDGLVAPLVMAVAVLVALAGLRLRGVVRAALTVAGSVTAIALPRCCGPRAWPTPPSCRSTTRATGCWPWRPSRCSPWHTSAPVPRCGG